MLGSHSAEVAVVERRDGAQPESLGYGDEAGVDPTEREVGVFLGQLSDAPTVLDVELLAASSRSATER